MRCQMCGRDLGEDDVYVHDGETLCEDCYIEASHRIRVCDPWGEYSARTFRKMHGLKGDEGLTEIQKKLYNLVCSRKLTREELQAELGLTPQKLENEIAILRHCQLVKGRREGDKVYIVPWEYTGCDEAPSSEGAQRI
ncbi:MAG: hypothetical protein NQU42_06285 [Methanothrix sp.]|uniref:LIM domain-containing protein n=1 Tax=Methanothrix sp. TaxID=90426 RepID=UPI0025D68520|nr:LIM domain-containing protein [Methanothrix sp.]MCQ8903682.1 hypothetical protein [Methanothrix sp.]